MQRPAVRQHDRSIAVLSVRGVALYDLEYQPFCFSTRKLASSVTDLANDPSVSAILLDISTPGGAVTGTAEAGNAIFAARSHKPILAIVNPLCASAGYWLASQASQIVAIPSADVGSIGVFQLHLDQSGLLENVGIKPTFIFAGPHKVEANPFEPLSAAAKQFLQGEVDRIYSDFRWRRRARPKQVYRICESQVWRRALPFKSCRSFRRNGRSDRDGRRCVSICNSRSEVPAECTI